MQRSTAKAARIGPGPGFGGGGRAGGAALAWARRRRIDTAGQRWSHACHANIGARRVPATGVRTMARVVCFGELLLRLSAPGREKLLQSPQLEVRIGGAEANVGVSLSCFGHQVAAVGTVADNALGEAAAGELRRYGVDTTGLRKVAGRMGLYFLAPGAIHRPAEVLYDRAGSAFAVAPAEAYAGRRCCAAPTGCTCPASPRRWAPTPPPPRWPPPGPRAPLGSRCRSTATSGPGCGKSGRVMPGRSFQS